MSKCVNTQCSSEVIQKSKANYAECYGQSVMWWTQKVTFLLGFSEPVGLPHMLDRIEKQLFWRGKPHG